MALTLTCDGCSCKLDATTAKPRGHIAKVYLCATCTAALETAEREIDAERVRMVEAFEDFRKTRLATLRETVRVLPDS